MGLFGFGKKKEEEKVSCSCGGMCTPSEIAAKEAAALAELGMDTTIEHVTDFSVIPPSSVLIK